VSFARCYYEWCIFVLASLHIRVSASFDKITDEKIMSVQGGC
jgi:hypothetical protein